VAEYCSDVGILGSYAGVAEAVNGIALVKPDLVF